MSEIVANNPVNEATGKEIHTRSSFDLGFDFYNTQRFGEYTPHFWMEGLDNDKLPLHSSHTVKSLTLATPLMSDIKMNKDYFFVPMMCILPLNWEKFYRNPAVLASGSSDVPDDAGTAVSDFFGKIKTLAVNSLNYLDTILSTGASSTETAQECLDAVFKFFVFFERFYSDGSLMSNLGIHGSKYFSMYTTSGDRHMISYDEWFDNFIYHAYGDINYFTAQYGSDSSTQVYVEITPNTVPVGYTTMKIGLRDFLELLRDDFSWTVTSVKCAVTFPSTDKDGLISDWNDFRSEYTLGSGVSPFIGTDGIASVDKPAIDLRRLWAYQIVCAHYFTNDKVDYVYSAELFRQYIRQLTTGIPSSGFQSVGFFTVNGLEYEYDALSAFAFGRVLSKFSASVGIFGSSSSTSSLPQTIAECYAYFRALFGFNRSLRYKDYFTGSRTRPLAVGDVNVPVSSNLVNVIDVTKNIQRQRFFNFVNRIPQQIEGYLEGLFGKRPAPDYHNPFFLARTTDDVFGQESEYTGNVTDAEANNITSLLRSQASRYAFEFEPDRDCVVIGVTSYDIPRAYSQSIERQAFHVNRFDFFNSFMQFIGDQSIYQAELGNALQPTKAPFGYQLRHMEYKQRYNQCAGAFRKFLPGWLFLADDSLRERRIINQSPDFIRSHNTELDKYFKVLTGYSLGSYFHFIVKNRNSMTASRPMAYAPSIL